MSATPGLDGLLGFHRACGGPVRVWRSAPYTSKKDGHVTVYTYPICSRCKVRVPEADISAQRTTTVRQSTRGVKAKRRRFDYNDWRDVK